jgi:hypothetical protein
MYTSRSNEVDYHPSKMFNHPGELLVQSISFMCVGSCKIAGLKRSILTESVTTYIRGFLKTSSNILEITRGMR